MLEGSKARLVKSHSVKRTWFKRCYVWPCLSKVVESDRIAQLAKKGLEKMMAEGEMLITKNWLKADCKPFTYYHTGQFPSSFSNEILKECFY